MAEETEVEQAVEVQGQAPEVQEQSTGQAQEQTEQSQQPAFTLPEEFVNKYGVKSLDEFAQKYQASSQEAHRLAEERNRERAVLEGYRELLAAQRQQPAQQQQQPSAQNDFFGFGSMEALQAAYQRDYTGTVNKILAHNLENNPDLIRKAVEPVMQKYMQPVQEREVAARRAANAQQFFSKYPEAKEGTQYYTATDNWIRQNEQLLAGLEQIAPNANLTEVAAKLATYDMMRQELEATKAKLGQNRSKAETVRPGTGGKAAPSGNSPKSSVLAALEDLRAAGKGEGVSEEMIAAAARSVETYLGQNFRPNKK